MKRQRGLADEEAIRVFLSLFIHEVEFFFQLQKMGFSESGKMKQDFHLSKKTVKFTGASDFAERNFSRRQVTRTSFEAMEQVHNNINMNL